MALIDDPKAFILRMFDMESREGRGAYCDVFECGLRSEELPLDEHELVYGIYKAKYYFSPQAFLIKEASSITRIEWSTISSCSTAHGDGNKSSTLTLLNGETIEVRIGDLATGWSGRTSQLFHKMIERWGHQAFTGLPLKTVDDYFNEATDKYSFAPNLEPHPSLAEIKAVLLAFQQREDVEKVMISIAEYDGQEPIAIGVVIVSAAPMINFNELRQSLCAPDLMPASDNTRKKLAVDSGSAVWELLWN